MSLAAPLLAVLLASAAPGAPANPPGAADAPPIAPQVSAAPCPVAATAQPQSALQAVPLNGPDYATASPSDPAEIVVSAQPKPPKEDPLREVNAKSFAVVNKVDDAIVGPLAMAYKHTVPEPVRDGLHNALSNLSEPVVFVNDLLQLKPVRAGKTLLRFVINTTIGLGGLFDIAKKKPFHLAHHNNGFADTLGYYGVGPGPYLYLPLIGPTSVRDLFGRTLDLALLPVTVGAPFNSPQFSLPNSALKSMDDRVNFDARQHYFRDDTSDPYGAERAWYLQLRANEIAGLHGHHPELTTPILFAIPKLTFSPVCTPAPAPVP
jgi:phospholipid-binding lipoprotein MlaA